MLLRVRCLLLVGVRCSLYSFWNRIVGAVSCLLLAECCLLLAVICCRLWLLFVACGLFGGRCRLLFCLWLVCVDSWLMLFVFGCCFVIVRCGTWVDCCCVLCVGRCCMLLAVVCGVLGFLAVACCGCV